MPTKQTEWSRAYNEKAYDRLAITIPKGQKQTVEAYAKARGKSINGLVNDMLMAATGQSETQWRGKGE